MNKKILILIVILILAILIAAYFLFFKKTEENKIIEQAISRLFPEIPKTGINGKEGPKESSLDGKKEEKAKQNLKRLTEKAVVGAMFNENNKTVYFIEKSTGHIYEISPNGENLKRVSNTTIPGIFEVYWSSTKKDIIFSYFKDDQINTFSAFLNSSSTESKAISSNVKSVLIPKEKNIFYYFEKIKGKGYVFENDFKLKNKRQIFSSSFTDFLLIPENKDNIGLITRPSFFSKGFLYSLNVKNKILKRVMGDMPGLAALWSNDGKKIFYTQSLEKEKSVSNKIADIGSNEELVLTLKTFVEKCVWSNIEKDVLYCFVPLNIPEGEYPDDWYKGVKEFEDELWKIDYKTGRSNVLELSAFPQKTDFDSINPFFSDDEKSLFFINRKDSSIWSFDFPSD